jgi:hypothetical protein
MFARFLPVFSEPWNRSEKGGKELVPPFCTYWSDENPSRKAMERRESDA